MCDDVFEVYLSSSVDVSCGITDGDGAHHFPVVQGVYLPCMARNSWSNQSIRRKGHGLHLAVYADMERVGTATEQHSDCTTDTRAPSPFAPLKLAWNSCIFSKFV